MTKQEYLSLRSNFYGLLQAHIREKIKISNSEFNSLISNWELLIRASPEMMMVRYKINYTPSEAYHFLVNYYDSKFELQILYFQDKPIKIIS